MSWVITLRQQAEARVPILCGCDSRPERSVHAAARALHRCRGDYSSAAGCHWSLLAHHKRQSTGNRPKFGIGETPKLRGNFEKGSKRATVSSGGTDRGYGKNDLSRRE